MQKAANLLFEPSSPWATRGLRAPPQLDFFSSPFIYWVAVEIRLEHILCTILFHVNIIFLMRYAYTHNNVPKKSRCGDACGPLVAGGLILETYSPCRFPISGD